MNEAVKITTNTEQVYHVTKDDLPLHCPTKEMTLWDSHPRVYLSLEKEGAAICPYCGTEYRLKEKQ